MIVANILGLRKYVRVLPHGALIDAVIKSGAQHLRNYRRRQETTAIPHNIQHGYSVVFANATAAQQALASGNQPVIPPPVDLGIPDDDVEDITEKVAPNLRSRLLQGQLGQHSTHSPSDEPLEQPRRPNQFKVNMAPPVHGINNTWLTGKGKGKAGLRRKTL